MADPAPDEKDRARRAQIDRLNADRKAHRRQRGLCTECGAAAAPDRMMCAAHLEQNAATARRRTGCSKRVPVPPACVSCGNKSIKARGQCRPCYYRAYPKQTRCGHQPYHCGGLCQKCYAAKRRDEHPDRSAYQRQTLLRHLCRKFGVPLSTVEALLAEGCAICGAKESPTEGRPTLHLDHNHETGAFRGVLCHACNVGLGQFRDSPELLSKAVAYLIVNEEKRTT